MSLTAARPSASAHAAPAADWTRIFRRLDLRVLLPALVLVAVGLLSIASDRPAVLLTQVRWVVVGAGILVAIVLTPYRRVLDLAYPFYALVLVLLVLVLVPGVGTRVNGATRWLRFGGMSLQPSELAKVAVVLVLARYIRFRRDHRTVKGLVVPFLLTLAPMALVVKEPDLGTALMLVPVLFALLWVAGARSRHLGRVVLLGLAAVPVLYMSLPEGHYQRKRVDAYLVALEPTGSLARERAVDTYHLEESLAAVAGGGLTGHGFRQGPQNRMGRVPESWTDFIFAVHAEEWGFVGVSVLLLAQLALLLGLATVARELREPAGRLLAVGAMVLLGTQCCVNMMMTVGLAPITGLPLPFVSYGGSAMISSWMLLGLALNARAREPVVFAGEDFE